MVSWVVTPCSSEIAHCTALQPTIPSLLLRELLFFDTGQRYYCEKSLNPTYFLNENGGKIVPQSVGICLQDYTTQRAP
jgi:hypothetical protein